MACICKDFAVREFIRVTFEVTFAFRVNMSFCKYANYVTLGTLNVSNVGNVRQLRQAGQYLKNMGAIWFMIDTCHSGQPKPFLANVF